MNERAVIHLDLDASFTAIEGLEGPALTGQPVLVGGRPGQRGEAPGGVVAIKLRYSAFTTLTRQMTLLLPNDDAVELCRAALTLLERTW